MQKQSKIAFYTSVSKMSKNVKLGGCNKCWSTELHQGYSLRFQDLARSPALCTAQGNLHLLVNLPKRKHL